MNIKTAILLFFLLVSKNLFSQGGGPPMLTTDPGTPGKNHWEINISLGYHFLNQPNIQIPVAEIVYGIGSRYQISVQLPSPNIELNESHFTTLSQPQIGGKWRLLDEENEAISLSVYPQIIIPLEKEQKPQIFIPLEFEKTFGNFRIGEEIGCFVLNNPNAVFSSTIIGFRFKNDVELMSEFYWSKTLNKSQSTAGMLNFGFRKQLNEHLVLMSSLGTKVITPYNEDREYLFGLIGVQLLLGR